MPRFTIRSHWLVFLLAAYNTVVFNYPFLSRFAAIDSVKHHVDQPWFFLTVPLLLFGLLSILFNLVVLPYITKPLLIVVTLTSSLVFYGSYTYGVVFDYHMIENVMQTDKGEALSYVNLYSILAFLITGVFPAILLARANIIYNGVFKEIFAKLLVMFGSIGLVLLLCSFFYQDYAVIGRNNHLIKRYLVPIQYLDSSYKYTRDSLVPPEPFKVLDKSPQLTAPTDQKNLMVMVVGETARAMNSAYNGYKRDTNAFTQPFKPVAFTDVASCGTATGVSVPCMFSVLKHSNFDGAEAQNQSNALDILKQAGVHIQWIENDGGCKGVCKRIPTTLIKRDDSAYCKDNSCYDSVMLPHVRQFIDHLSSGTNLLVLHIMGSHGPTYFQRYPSDFGKFKPDCPRSDIQNCQYQQIVNTYDNTILYTDYILSKIMTELKALPDDVNASLLYLSDHGESLGEDNVYLHGMPYAFAPIQQRRVPMLFWSTPQFNQQNKLDKACLRKEATTSKFSQDNIFHSLLGILNVTSTLYKKSLDIFAQCRQAS